LGYWWVWLALHGFEKYWYRHELTLIATQVFILITFSVVNASYAQYAGIPVLEAKMKDVGHGSPPALVRAK